ncbi:S8 family peptidase [Flavobacterium sp. '19STA2R22 D10 B1']|uniref:S8 family peptidase n=1 Tax=Flavobacterium aerium TaxID=3037261 RepID=UPI00278BF6CC|nr:S8/S53 family peptidase [Flavobacterium sp. '19STA2R22 D10 B1']
MKKIYFNLVILTLILLTSCSKEGFNDSIPNGNPPESPKDPLTAVEINAKIDESIQTKGTFNWNEASNHMLWSAVVRGQNILTIGFGSSANDFDRSKLSGSANQQRELLQLIADSEGISTEKTLVGQDDYLTIIDVVVTKIETINQLRQLKGIRYIEPADYRYFDAKGNISKSSSSGSSSGCGFDGEAISSADYTTVTPNARVPWNFYKHNIPTAWSTSTGRGVTIGIVDTGVSDSQTLLGSNFNNGQSSGRTIQKYGVYVDSIWPWSSTTDGSNDKCGHGTSMSAVATAPRNDNGQPVGVAYNANLIVYRAASNVILEGYHEQKGVEKAFTALGNNANVKIISMSMGHIFSVGRIEDGIKYAYSKGKLIFGAGGTSTSFTNFVGVIFPASMAEVVAVTGVKESATHQECDVCHKGGKIDFTVVMERAGTLSTIPVLGYYNNESSYVGGSSVATATTAGIAALVWSKNPSWTRDQVLNKMKQSGNFYPNKNANFGYGNVNASLAVQ